MKRTLWLGFAVFFSCALCADGYVVVKSPGEKVNLPCGVDQSGGTVTWKHEDSVVIQVDKNGFPRKGKVDLVQRATVRRTALEITGVKEADAGMFTCTVNRNSEQHFLFVVTVSARPSAVLQLGGSATLHCQVKGLPLPPSAPQWRKPDGNPHPGSEEAELNPVARSDEGAWNCTFSHDGLMYGKSLDIRVTGAATTPAKPVPSDKGKEAPTCNDCVTNRPSLPLRLSWWMWAVIAVGCLILVVLMAFIVYLCKRIQRKKRKLRRMENSRQLLMPKQYCQCNRPTAVPKMQQRRQRQKPSAPPLQPVLVQ
ncbi:hypothetical protein fugu_010266 [Takifugu bimaculatus]|uniref:Ig-like domain-containing protein n=1 Tax=Takifugu bimaculatus TaxID=433685 RepID=A0A4Z2CF09_9TELE|nr:hypothetical protein fugu_010266 [Takifugu bimaculatus]